MQVLMGEERWLALFGRGGILIRTRFLLVSRRRRGVAQPERMKLPECARPMKNSIVKVAGIAALSAVISAAAGCSGNHQTQSGQAAAVTLTATTDDVKPLRPCEKLSVADVQPLFNTPVEIVPDPVSDAPIQSCTVRTTDGIQAIQILIAVGPAVQMFADKSPTDDGKAGIALTGIGDHAFRESKDVWVYAFKNGSFCMIHGDHSGENAQGSKEELRGLKLSDSLAGTIPAATAQQVAQNLGTLCNRIWGSGNTALTAGEAGNRT
jgi:hypothetical protein